MSRVPAELGRVVHLPCGVQDESGTVHNEVMLHPLTMLESCRMEATATKLPNELEGLLDLQSWAVLCRTAATVRQLGHIPEDEVTAELLLELAETDCLFLSAQCKEVSLASTTFRGGQGSDQGGGVSGSDGDRMEREGADGDA